MLTKVWLLLFITMLTMVFSLSLFSKISLMSIYNNNPKESPGLKLKRKTTTLLNFAGSYLVYVLNIITNQGELSPFQQKIHI